MVLIRVVRDSISKTFRFLYFRNILLSDVLLTRFALRLKHDLILNLEVYPSLRFKDDRFSYIGITSSNLESRGDLMLRYFCAFITQNFFATLRAIKSP